MYNFLCVILVCLQTCAVMYKIVDDYLLCTLRLGATRRLLCSPRRGAAFLDTGPINTTRRPRSQLIKHGSAYLGATSSSSSVATTHREIRGHRPEAPRRAEASGRKRAGRAAITRATCCSAGNGSAGCRIATPRDATRCSDCMRPRVEMAPVQETNTPDPRCGCVAALLRCAPARGTRWGRRHR